MKYDLVWKNMKRNEIGGGSGRSLFLVWKNRVSEELERNEERRNHFEVVKKLYEWRI